jgi:hypothetical protein
MGDCQDIYLLQIKNKIVVSRAPRMGTPNEIS